MKFVRKYKTLAEARSHGNAGIESPHIDMTEGYNAVNIKQVIAEKFTCGFDNQAWLTNPQPVITRYTVTLVAGANGTVSGGGRHAWGTKITIVATPNTGYVFSQWSDGGTSATREYTVTQDITLTASFVEVPMYTVTLTAGEGGSVSGGGSYRSGTTISISGIPDAGYSFVAWSDGNTNAVRSLVVNSDISLSCSFMVAQTANQIFYTTTNGAVMQPYNTDEAFYWFTGPWDDWDDYGELSIVSNTYVNGQGVITFDGPVNYIGENAFYYCPTLKTMTLPGQLREIARYNVFDLSYNLRELTLPESIEGLASLPYACQALTLASETPPELSSYAFMDATFIKVPTAVKSTYLNATNWRNFADNINLGTTEDSITKIYYTSSNGSIIEPLDASEVTIPIGSGADSFGANIVSNTYDATEGYGTIVFDGTVTKIGDSAFYYKRTLTGIKLPNTITTIGEYAFYGDDAIKIFNMPRDLTTVKEYAFNESQLINIILPNSVTTIEDYAFYECYIWYMLCLPSTITAIGERAFAKCNPQYAIFCEATTPPSLGLAAFDPESTGSDPATIYVPAASLNAYKNHEDWIEYDEEGRLDTIE